MQVAERSRGPFVAAAAVALVGLAASAGGLWLAMLGGSWFYLALGAAMVVTAYLLWRRRPTALWVYAALVAATLVWSLWEAGLDWWPLAARGDVIFVLGVVMLTPWVTRGIGSAAGMAPSVRRRGTRSSLTLFRAGLDKYRGR